VATTGLLALLCTTYPDFHIVFIALIALDIFSHWFQMHQTLLAGSTTHKVRAAKANCSGQCLTAAVAAAAAAYFFEICPVVQQHMVPLQAKLP
jgi:hypothetical protein